MLKKITTALEFDDSIKTGTYLVDFSATWCGPCQMLEPILVDLSSELNILQIDVDEVSDLAYRYGVMSIPTLIVFKDGKEISKSIGYKTKEEIEDLVK